MSPNQKKALRAVATLAVVAGGIGYLFYASAGEAFEYYKHIDEVMPTADQWVGKKLQLHGFVVPGSIEKRLDKEHQQIEYKFRAVNCGQSVEVRYAGTVPDTFKDGAEVVVKGTLAGQERFQAREIMAKCPSKYQAGVNNPSATMCAKGDKTAEAKPEKAM
jgi:cytochrome c-type biogenesis protein CcmE